MITTAVIPMSNAFVLTALLLIEEDDRRTEGAAPETLGRGAVRGAVVSRDDVRVFAGDHVTVAVVEPSRAKRSDTHSGEARNRGDARRFAFERRERARAPGVDLSLVGQGSLTRRVAAEVAGHIELRRCR